MPFDHSKLAGRIVEKFGSRKAFCAAIGMAESALSLRINNLMCFDAEEIRKICEPDVLDIPGEELHLYFFTPKV